MASIPKTIRAAQWDPTQQKVVVNTIPTPTPSPNQLLIKLASASLCHSDLMAIAQPDLTHPFTLGHEGAGYIAALGSDIPHKKLGFAVGDPVGFLYINGCCFECEGCAVHNMHCSRGTPVVAGFGHGGVKGDFGFFQEFAAVDWQNVVKLPAELDPRRSSAVFCAGITAFHAVDSCTLKPNQWLAVVGAGGLGQLAVQYAKAMGFKVVALDINDKALDACKSQGADVTLNTLTNSSVYVSEIKSLTDGGVHAAAVFSGSPAAYKSAPPIIRPGGVLMVVGISPKPLELSSFDLAIGSFGVRADSTGTPARMGKAVRFTAEHGIVPQIEVREGLESVAEMVGEMSRGESNRRMAVVFE
ncbi:chaperonin 10-like protein [Aspergillus heterothallicus]